MRAKTSIEEASISVSHLVTLFTLADFATGFAAMNNLKLRFLPNLRLALAVYPATTP